MYKYPVISFEGIEASGKSTNLTIAVNYLKKNKKKFISLREPGGSNFSEKIRKLLLDKKFKLNRKTDLMLFFAARSENFEKLIEKNYKKKIILIDRFIDSTVAYQHFGMGINKNLIDQLNKFLLNGIRPNLTILNLVSKNNLKKRLRSRKNKNRYDKFSFNFYEKVQKGFLKIAKNKNNYFIIDSNKDIKTNNQQIISIIKKKIN